MQLPVQNHIEVDSFVRYSTDSTLVKNSSDWDAQKVRYIMKGESFNGYISMLCNGSWQKITENNAHLCEQELVRQCALRIISRTTGLATIVPVPNSGATPANQDFKTLKHVREIAGLAGKGFLAKPLLLWSSPQEKSHTGGRSRLYRDHLQHLILNGSTDRPIILYDDVVTSGSQLIASKLKLEAAGHKILGMVAVISVLEKDGATHSDLFSWRTDTRQYLG